MVDKKVRALDALGKETILLKDGSLQGKVQSLVVDEQQRSVKGIFVRLKKLLNNLSYSPLERIQAFGTQGVTLKDELVQDNTGSGYRDILGMPVITLDGSMLGKIDDYIFDTETGLIEEYILSGGLVKDRFQGKANLSGERISLIGKDVILATADLSDEDLEEAVFFGEEDPDLIKDENEEERKDFRENLQETKEFVGEKFNEGKKSAEKIWNQTLSTAKSLSERFVVKAGELGAEAKDSLEKLNVKREQWQEKLKDAKKISKSDLGDKLLAELRGKTVSATLYSDDNELIVEAGATITDEVITKAIELEKTYELMQLVAACEVESQIIEVEKKEKE